MTKAKLLIEDVRVEIAIREGELGREIVEALNRYENAAYDCGVTPTQPRAAYTAVCERAMRARLELLSLLTPTPERTRP